MNGQSPVRKRRGPSVLLRCPGDDPHHLVLLHMRQSHAHRVQAGRHFLLRFAFQLIFDDPNRSISINHTYSVPTDSADAQRSPPAVSTATRQVHFLHTTALGATRASFRRAARGRRGQRHSRRGLSPTNRRTARTDRREIALTHAVPGALAQLGRGDPLPVPPCAVSIDRSARISGTDHPTEVTAHLQAPPAESCRPAPKGPSHAQSPPCPRTHGLSLLPISGWPTLAQWLGVRQTGAVAAIWVAARCTRTLRR